MTSRPLPSVQQHSTWQSFANALLSVLVDGAPVNEAEVGYIVANVPISPPQLPPLPTGVFPVWFNSVDATAYLGNPDYDPPTAPEIVFIDTQNIAEAAIETANIADGTIVGGKIANLTIVSALIGDAQIVNAKIGDLAVNEAKIANLAVSSAKIANLAVGSAQIQLLAVGSAHIADAAIVSAKIGAAQIETAHIAAAQITTALIANAQITTALIANAAITNALIGNLAVNTAQIQDLAVSTGKIQDLAVSSAKISSLIIDKIVAGTLDAEIDMGTGLIRFTIGGNTLTLGKGFGTSNQFIMWFGPSMAENLMSEFGAIFYLKANGDAYFGGSLSAGTLHNSASSSSTITPVTIETGTFGSNEGPRYYTAGWTYTKHGGVPVGGGGAVGGTPINADLYIEKWNGSSWDILASVHINGGSDYNPPYIFEGDQYPGDLTEHAAGSVTFTDNTGGTSVDNLRARMANRADGITFSGTWSSPVVTQRVSIQSVEE
jgi:hypothetical protein